MSKHETVFVGLSGGVDSSVAAARLQDQGYNVVGVFIKVWQPDFIQCDWEHERLDAMRVAARLRIPFLTCDAEAAYRDEVAQYFINEYLAGRTPNPDVMCNQYVKFGYFLDFAKMNGADKIATGHYAQHVISEAGHDLVRGVDAGKDQSYFLWSLQDEQLQNILFPVGNTTKELIRQEAEQAKLVTAHKRDSQGICFLGHIDIVDFLSHYTELQEGDVLNTKGQVVGRHQGALVYTLGQRHGFTITTQQTAQPAQYVIDRNLSQNTITVAPHKPTINQTETIELTNTYFRNQYKPQVGEEVTFQIRYRQNPVSGIVQNVSDAGMRLQPHSATDAPATGQSCVLYRGTVCLGGGIIQ